MRGRALVLGIVVTVLLLCAAGVLYVLSSGGGGGQGYREAVALTRQIQQLSSDWSVEIARVKSDPLADFDSLAAFLPRMARLEESLSRTVREIPDLPERLASDVNAYLSELEAKEERIERFKTGYAVVRNSVRYLPLAAANVTRQAQAQGDEALVGRIAVLAQDMNLYLTNATEESGARLGEELARLREASVALAPARANALANLLAHAEVLLAKHAPTEELFRRATSGEISESSERLAGSFEFELARKERLALWYERGVLAAVALLALFWVGLALQQRARGAGAPAMAAGAGAPGGRVVEAEARVVEAETPRAGAAPARRIAAPAVREEAHAPRGAEAGAQEAEARRTPAPESRATGVEARVSEVPEPWVAEAEVEVRAAGAHAPRGAEPEAPAREAPAAAPSPAVWDTPGRAEKEEAKAAPRPAPAETARLRSTRRAAPAEESVPRSVPFAGEPEERPLPARAPTPPAPPETEGAAEAALLHAFVARCVADTLAASTARIATRMDYLRQTQDRVRHLLQHTDALLPTLDDGTDLDEEIEAAGAVTSSVRRDTNTIADLARRLGASSALPNGLLDRDLIDLNACVDDALRTTGAERAATVAKRLGTLPELFASRTEIRLLLAQVIDNAVHAVQDLPGHTGTIKIDTSRRNGDILVTVIDNGPGISAERRVHIFKPFYTTRDGAMGLGLPLARHLAARYEGSVQVNSLPDQGTVTRITLPADSPGN